jgi:hypothetical protein
MMAQPNFQIGDKVWLNSKNIHTTRPAKKLDYKKLGPFKILEKVNNHSYRLDLPQNYKIHPVFHVSLLERYQPDLIPGRAPRRPPPVEVRGEQEYFVKQIEDSRWFKGTLQYYVNWDGYQAHEKTWEAARNLESAPEAVADFHHRFPHKPRPPGFTALSPWRGSLSQTRPQPLRLLQDLHRLDASAEISSGNIPLQKCPARVTPI